jgi:hypothetical protein
MISLGLTPASEGATGPPVPAETAPRHGSRAAAARGFGDLVHQFVDLRAGPPAGSAPADPGRISVPAVRAPRAGDGALDPPRDEDPSQEDPAAGIALHAGAFQPADDTPWRMRPSGGWVPGWLPTRAPADGSEAGRGGRVDGDTPTVDVPADWSLTMPFLPPDRPASAYDCRPSAQPRSGSRADTPGSPRSQGTGRELLRACHDAPAERPLIAGTRGHVVLLAPPGAQPTPATAAEPGVTRTAAPAGRESRGHVVEAARTTTLEITARPASPDASIDAAPWHPPATLPAAPAPGVQPPAAAPDLPRAIDVRLDRGRPADAGPRRERGGTNRLIPVGRTDSIETGPPAPAAGLPPARTVIEAPHVAMASLSGEPSSRGGLSAVSSYGTPAPAEPAAPRLEWRAPAALAPLPPATEADLPEQIVQTIRVQVHEGGGEARIRLRPEYLGELTLRVSVDQGVVTARLEAESASVRRWIEQHEGSLRDALGQHGLTLGSLHVSEHEHADSDGARERRDAWAPRDDDAPSRRRRKRSDDDPEFDFVA